MAITVTTDMVLGIGALLVAFVVIIMFLRATDSTKEPKEDEEIRVPKSVVVNVAPRKVNVTSPPSITIRVQVEQARSQIRTLSLKQEILSMVMKRLFEAEDNGEISKAERELLSKSYETEIQEVNEQLKKSELLVSLNELEDIRANIINQFQQTLSDTQTQIDLIIKELNLKQPEPKLEEKLKPELKSVSARKRRPRPQPQEEEIEEELEEDEEEDTTATGRRETVEDRLDKLKQDVLKELEELERLELEQ